MRASQIVRTSSRWTLTSPLLKSGLVEIYSTRSIIVTPKLLPLPVQRVIDGLSDTNQVLVALSSL